jgi:hypothetical protein
LDTFLLARSLIFPSCGTVRTAPRAADHAGSRVHRLSASGRRLTLLTKWSATTRLTGPRGSGPGGNA